MNQMILQAQRIVFKSGLTLQEVYGMMIFATQNTTTSVRNLVVCFLFLIEISLTPNFLTAGVSYAHCGLE